MKLPGRRSHYSCAIVVLALSLPCVLPAQGPAMAARIDEQGAPVLVHETPGLNLSVTGGNSADIALARHAQGLPLLQEDGVLIPTITNTAGYLAAEAPGDLNFGPVYGGQWISTGGPNSEFPSPVTCGFFPFANGWGAAHVQADGVIQRSRNLPAGTVVARSGAGRYLVTIPGTTPGADGVLLATSTGDATAASSVPARMISVAPSSSGSSWEVAIRQLNRNLPDGDDSTWSFVHLPFATPGLVAGVVNAAGTIVASAGSASVQRVGAGRYEVTIAQAASAADGVLLVVSNGFEDNGQAVAPSDNVIAARWTGSGTFTVQSRDMPSGNAQNASFIYCFVPFHQGSDMGTVTLSGNDEPALELAAGFGLEVDASNVGDTMFTIDGRSFPQTQGVLLATVRANDPPAVLETPGELSHPTGTIPTNWNGGSYLASDSTQVGELRIATALAWFPFAAGWTAGHVGGDGELLARTGLPADIDVIREGLGRYGLAMPNGASSAGALFVIGNSNADRNRVSTYPRVDGFRVAVRDVSHDVSNGEDDGWSFVYLPYDTERATVGRVDANGTLLAGGGSSIVTRTGPGTYAISIPGVNAATDGILLLAVSNAVNGTQPDDNHLQYTIDASGVIEVRSYDMPGNAPQDTVWSFAFIHHDRPARTEPPYPGNDPDLLLSSSVGSLAFDGAGRKEVQLGEPAALRVSSPSGALEGRPFFMAASVFPTALGSPGGVPGVEGSHVNILVPGTWLQVAGDPLLSALFGGVSFPLTASPAVVTRSGFDVTLPAEITGSAQALNGASLLFQALVQDASSPNGLALSDAHEIRFVDEVIYVDGANGTPTGPGTRSAPFATVAQGLAAASSSMGRREVWVASGTYIETLDVLEGVDLLGGRDPARGWSRNGFTEVVAGSLEPHRFRTVIGGPHLVEGMVMRSVNQAFGTQSSYGAMVDGGSWHFRECEFLSDDGLAGGDGVQGSQASPMFPNPAPDGGASGVAYAPGVPSAGWPGGRGGVGGYYDGSACISPTAGGRALRSGSTGTAALGGAPGSPSWCNSSGFGRRGGDGDWGANGPVGAAGRPGSVAISFGPNGFVAQDGTNGGQGGRGAAGGGGGGGGMSTGDFFGVRIRNAGGGGGVGGIGGYGGGGGTGGRGGGASVSLWIKDGQVLLEDCHFETGRGGNGGHGGAGGVKGFGGSGGDGAAGEDLFSTVNIEEGGIGGDGGIGGFGGHGGPGGGGAGGPRIGIAASATSQVTQVNSTFTYGPQGMGGCAWRRDGTLDCAVLTMGPNGAALPFSTY